MASRQFSSGTPKLSSIISERSHPGVMATALEQLATPDVVHENVDVAVVVSDLLGQALDLIGVEMVDGTSDTNAAETRHELGGLFDCLGSVVIGSP